MGKMGSGQTAPFPFPGHGISRNDSFITELLDDKASFENPPRALQGEFADLAELVEKKCDAAKRLSHLDRFLPGYGPGDSDVTVHVLGPILEKFGTRRGLRKLGSGRYWESKTRNGHSVVYRFDYGNARILMTGDLNEESQRLLMSYVDKDEYASDIAKGCHHGSADVNMDFLKAMKPRSTVMSCGDNENYSHPRAVILGASAKYGRESKNEKGHTQAPLIYATEIARSVNLAYPSRVGVDADGSGPDPVKTYPASKGSLKAPGRRGYRPLKNTPVAVDLIYGLVNVRTDGETVMCAVMKEKGSTFDRQFFQAGVDVDPE